MKQRLLTLFRVMLGISAFTFGGGFVIVGLMKRRFVDELHWLDEDEMLDMAALAQSAPGAIAVNAAILVGRKVGGAKGVAVAVLGTVLPPLAIIGVVSIFYEQFATNVWVAAVLTGMQAGVAAVIVDVVLSLSGGITKVHDWAQIAIAVGVFCAAFIMKCNVMLILLCVCVIGIIRYYCINIFAHRRRGGEA